MTHRKRKGFKYALQRFLKRNGNILPFVAIGLTLVLVLLIAVLIFAGGAGANPGDNTTDNTTVTTEPTTENTSNTTLSDDPNVTLPYTHPLTGEPLEEPCLDRPIAVMLNNMNVAMPQHGNSQADIFYEVLAEGGITRCMGIYTNIEAVEKIGSLRSARKYYIDIALGYGAAFVHAGQSDEARDYLTTLKNFDLSIGNSATCTYRDSDRLNAGYSLEHTLFTSGKMILDFANQCNVTTALDEGKSYNMTFDNDKVYAGDTAEKVTVYFNRGGKSTALTYNPDTKLYSAYQHGENYIDGNTRQTLTFRNVLVLKMPTSAHTVYPGLLVINTVGSGDGYYICNGQKVDIQWSRDSVNEPFRYKLKNGDELTFATGKTYVAVVPTTTTIDFQ